MKLNDLANSLGLEEPKDKKPGLDPVETNSTGFASSIGDDFTINDGTDDRFKYDREPNEEVVNEVPPTANTFTMNTGAPVNEEEIEARVRKELIEELGEETVADLEEYEEVAEPKRKKAKAKTKKQSKPTKNGKVKKEKIRVKKAEIDTKINPIDRILLTTNPAGIGIMVVCIIFTALVFSKYNTVANSVTGKATFTEVVQNEYAFEIQGNNYANSYNKGIDGLERIEYIDTSYTSVGIIFVYKNGFNEYFNATYYPETNEVTTLRKTERYTKAPEINDESMGALLESYVNPLAEEEYTDVSKLMVVLSSEDQAVQSTLEDYLTEPMVNKVTNWSLPISSTQIVGVRTDDTDSNYLVILSNPKATYQEPQMYLSLHKDATGKFDKVEII